MPSPSENYTYLSSPKSALFPIRIYYTFSPACFLI